MLPRRSWRTVLLFRSAGGGGGGLDRAAAVIMAVTAVVVAVVAVVVAVVAVVVTVTMMGVAELAVVSSFGRVAGKLSVASRLVGRKGFAEIVPFRIPNAFAIASAALLVCLLSLSFVFSSIWKGLTEATSCARPKLRAAADKLAPECWEKREVNGATVEVVVVEVESKVAPVVLVVAAVCVVVAVAVEGATAAN